MGVAGGPEARIRALAQRQESRPTTARERVLAEAFVLFYANGIRAVGVDLIIARSDVAKASFYRHFASKQDLVLAYLDRRHEAWLAWLRDGVQEAKGRAEARLLTIFDLLAELFADPDYRGSATINAVVEVGQDMPEVLERARMHRAELRDYVADLASGAGLRRPREIGDQWCVLIDGAMVAAHCNGDTRPAGAARIVAAAILWSNGKGRPASRAGRTTANRRAR